MVYVYSDIQGCLPFHSSSRGQGLHHLSGHGPPSTQVSTKTCLYSLYSCYYVSPFSSGVPVLFAGKRISGYGNAFLLRYELRFPLRIPSPFCNTSKLSASLANGMCRVSSRYCPERYLIDRRYCKIHRIVIAGLFWPVLKNSNLR